MRRCSCARYTCARYRCAPRGPKGLISVPEHFFFAPQHFFVVFFRSRETKSAGQPIGKSANRPFDQNRRNVEIGLKSHVEIGIGFYQNGQHAETGFHRIRRNAETGLSKSTKCRIGLAKIGKMSNPVFLQRGKRLDSRL